MERRVRRGRRAWREPERCGAVDIAERGKRGGEPKGRGGCGGGGARERDARGGGVGNLDGARRFGPTRGSDDTNTQRV